MGLFDNHIKSGSSKTILTTKDFFIGSAEAEAETSRTKILITEFFEDWLNVLEKINNEKFIILGRKGSGKSAIGEYICSIAKDDPNLFAKFVLKKDIDIERIVQIGKDEGTEIQTNLLFEWVILTQILNLMKNNENLSSIEKSKDLTAFLERNRGFVDIKNDEIVNTIRKTGIELSIESLKRFFKGTFKRDIEIAGQKAPFFKLIPYLKDTVFHVLLSDCNNNYVIIFDDLDINYKNTDSNKDAIADLLRIAKNYNKELGEKGLDTKILVLLRNDISTQLSPIADTAKIFDSYATTLNWYEEGVKEKDILLKKFINKRIETNFKKLGIQYDTQDPWKSFVSNDNYGKKTSFKYVLDHTFYRPRDLVVFFKDIDQYQFPIPISRDNINKLIGSYADSIAVELKNELSATFDAKHVDIIFETLKLAKGKFGDYFSYSDFFSIIPDTLTDGQAKQAVRSLLYYSILGFCNCSGGEQKYNYRNKEPKVDIEINNDSYLCFNNAINVYLQNLRGF